MAGSRRQPVALGVDIGGTKIAVGLVDRTGNVVAESRLPTQPTHESLERARQAADALIRAHSKEPDLVGVGVGVPELVDPEGVIVSSAVIPWSTVDISSAFADLGVPIQVESDIRAAATAESVRGAGRDAPSFLFVNVGTGISHCLVVEGRPWIGARGAAILSGSTTLTVLDATADRTVRGDVESTAAGGAISARYRRATGASHSAAEVFALAEAGDRVATRIRDDAIALVGSLATNLIDILDPGLVVIGGGVATAPGFVSGVDEVVRSRAWFRDGLPRVVPASCGDGAGLIGAGLVGHAIARSE